ncbi:MAG TPA: tetratricopeptide repeat protein [Verrucomicrobiae bacterium]|jgi:tetratricopeptide (TPR) repeat protein
MKTTNWIWLMAGCVLILLVAMLMPSTKVKQAPGPAASSRRANSDDWHATVERLAATQERDTNGTRTAQEIVAARLKKFGARRRALVDRLAEHYKIKTLPDAGRFFDAMDAGDWDETLRLFRSLRSDLDGPDATDLRKYWRAILEAYGAAEQAHMWPAQQFLDYGNGILNALKPGMVYVGGTDPGCFICTMMNETTEGEEHLTLTQNALADSNYLAYLTALYGSGLNVPTEEDEQAAFNKYVTDATARLQHDRQFPDEPKQVLPGEDIAITDGHTGVSGQVAVMSINNLVMQTLLQKNPDLSFAMEESFPLQSSYAGAAPLGPVFELRAEDPMTEDMASQAVNYWQSEAQNLQAAGETSDPVLRSYSHDANSEGNLLANSAYPVEAGQAYQTALSIYPGSVEAITGLTRLLAGQGQFDQAGQALDAFLQKNPGQSETIGNLRQTWLAGH